MAKGKRAAALFEVIHRDVRYAPVRRRSSPMQWLKDRLPHPRASVTPHAAQHSDSAVATADADPTLRPHPMLMRTGTGPALPSQGLGMTQVEPGDRPLPGTAAPGMAPPHPIGAPSVLVDRSRQVIKLRLSYTSAAIAAFAVVVALGLAYILGRGGTPTASVPESGQTTDEIRAGAITPGVMDINPNEQGGLADRMTAAPASTAKPLPPPPAPTARGERIVGMNYVIVQSYPDEADALAAAEVLRQHGVAASVVKGTAFAPRWYSVVGMEPFDHLSGNAAYRQYIARIKQISDKFAGNSKFKKFEPRPYKWQNH